MIRFAPGMTLYGPAAKCRCSMPDDEPEASAAAGKTSRATAQITTPAAARLKMPPAFPALVGTPPHVLKQVGRRRLHFGGAGALWRGPIRVLWRGPIRALWRTPIRALWRGPIRTL